MAAKKNCRKRMRRQWQRARQKTKAHIWAQKIVEWMNSPEGQDKDRQLEEEFRKQLQPHDGIYGRAA